MAPITTLPGPTVNPVDLKLAAYNAYLQNTKVTEKKESTLDVEKWLGENVKPFNGDPNTFLSGPTERTKKVLEVFEKLLSEEIKKGVLDVDATTPSSITSHGPGYITGRKEDEVIFGIQTDAPLKRSIKPLGGLNSVKAACKAYNFALDPKVVEIFSKYRKTHNEGVFDVYTPEIRKCRHSHIITGLPDAYARGRIIGDYRRVALYGVKKIMEAKAKDKDLLENEDGEIIDQIQLTEEVSEQIKALKELVAMAKSYGEEFDLMRPAQNAKEAIQWTYFAYLAAIKQQDGAAMSMGRMDSFFDVFIERDIADGKLTEEEAQELIDDFVIKCRMVRHLRTPEYNDLFAGDPTWVTMTLGGCDRNGHHLVTKTSYRVLQSLYNLGPAPEPNITILWSTALPTEFKQFCSRVSVETSSIQFENDDLMRPVHGGDYSIACCVSPMVIGKQMQFFGARCNLAKLLLYSMNEGVDEVHPEQVGPKFPKLPDGPLDYEEVRARYWMAIEWMAALYVKTMNRIHYMHDKYFYESLEMALHDTHVVRWMAFGAAGLSVVADSLSAIKYAKVTAIRDPKTGVTTSFTIDGDFPKFGNDDSRVDNIAQEVIHKFIVELRKHKTYRDATHTLSILTITSNIVYGKNTGATPDGRLAGVPFAPGGNPMHGRDSQGALSSLNSVASIPFSDCQDGISNTFSIVPSALGKTLDARVDNLAALLDGYFARGGQHINVNVLNRETLVDAISHPEKYPNLTIRVSGYAVHFTKLTHAQQLEVISRTFHSNM